MSARPNNAGRIDAFAAMETCREKDCLLDKLTYQKAKIEKLSQKLVRLQAKVTQQLLEHEDLEEEVKILTGNWMNLKNCILCDKTWNAVGKHRVASLNCGHLFGKKCVKKFVAVYKMCPGCEQPAEVEDLRYINGI
ncbi:uncharacterized protein LOC119555925 [Drosophila subpulchrella]|uniref:uncharacterized protein LOC119555925 n=1 Tax=Drosophila subpulchrella TaxID=1486046 RepID=UPI0018A15B3B|nr:uncharacterized protein LOC119555925 [Drosophila subpulchrella]